MGALYLGDALGGNRINPQYSNINWRGSDGFSSYSGLNVKLAANNLRGGVNFTANYTWSHSIDNLSNTFSEGGNGTFQLGYTDPFDPARDKGNSKFDVRHRFVFSGVWKIPWGSHSNNWLVNKVLGGWSFAPIFTARTGTPFTIYDCTNTHYSCPRFVPGDPLPLTGSAGAGTGTPNQFTYINLPVIANPDYDGENDTRRFIPVGTGTAVDFPDCTGLLHTGCSLPYSEIGRNAYRSPGAWNLNFSVAKTVTLTEQMKMEFRGELYNALNHHNYYVLTNNADASVGSDTANYSVDVKKGGYGDSRDERRNIQLGVKLIF